MAIISQIQGGLGNQMFQYAFGRSMALKYETSLFLDERWFHTSIDEVTPREFLLPKMRIQAKIASYDGFSGSPSRLRKVAQCFLPISPFVVQEKKAFISDTSWFHLHCFASQDFYVRGYWQSYKYFSQIRPELLDEFTPCNPIGTHYENYHSQILAQDSTMVHVRRGDYVSLPGAAKVHGGLVNLSYYQRAMDWVLARKPHTHFYIFSDDLEWAKVNLPHAERSTYVNNALECDAAVKELALMKACKNHIIANSSLSWWGAWLAEPHLALRSIVICPQRWTNDSKAIWNDLLLPAWQKL